MPSGRKAGNLLPAPLRGMCVTGDGVPPAEETRNNSLVGPGEKTMTPARFHVPPRPLGESHKVCAGPPAIAIFFSLPCWKKPMFAASGDQKGYVAPSVPASVLDSSVSRARIHT